MPEREQQHQRPEDQPGGHEDENEPFCGNGGWLHAEQVKQRLQCGLTEGEGRIAAHSRRPEPIARGAAQEASPYRKSTMYTVGQFHGRGSGATAPSRINGSDRVHAAAMGNPSATTRRAYSFIGAPILREERPR